MKFKISLLLPIFVFFFFSCGDDESGNDAKYDTTKVVSDKNNSDSNNNEELSIVCMWKAVSLKETPSSKGKYITTIYLGEIAKTYGETVTDSSTSKTRDFVKIVLGDGTEGWIQKNLMAIDAKPYVITSNSKLYKRPDILTAGKKDFEKMQFVVVTEMQEDWMKVKGKKSSDSWFSEGWVKSSHISNSEIDVTVAILAERALAIEDEEKKLTALTEIINNSDFSSSTFISTLEELEKELMYKDMEEESGEEELKETI